MEKTSFNLVTDAWISVRGPDGLQDVSLTEAFQRAHEFDGIAGEIPSQDAAILRLLLAVLHRAVEPVRGYPGERWSRLWHADCLPMDLIGDYLAAWSHRLDLVDPEAPFMQVARLTANKTSGLVKLIADVPDGYAFFTTRSGTALESIGLAEAARWLIHSQAYDTGGIKTGAHGDPRARGGKGYAKGDLGTAWAGRCGLVILEGANLRETLLLNLVLEPRERDSAPDLPVWERPPLGPAAEEAHVAPAGPADLMSWSSRRIRLHRNGNAVTDALVAYGDAFAPQNRQGVETMSGFLRPKSGRSTGGPIAYWPRRHDPARSIWRGLGAFLVEQSQAGAVNSEAAETLPPANVAWLSKMRYEDVLDPDLPVRLRAIGMSYGTMESSIEATYDDAVSLHVAVATDPDLRTLALEAAASADKAVQHLANLASNVAKAGGRAPEGPRHNARESAFALLDAPYRRWLSGLTRTTDLELARTAWYGTTRRIVRGGANDVIEASGAAAWKGRHVQGRHLSSALAEAWFAAALAKTLPLPTDSRTPRSSHDSNSDDHPTRSSAPVRPRSGESAPDEPAHARERRSPERETRPRPATAQ